MLHTSHSPTLLRNVDIDMIPVPICNLCMQVPGSHRFPTLTALGVLGGIGAFDNAIQGALLGPILLSSIAVFFDLHVRLIAGLPPSASTASLASLSRSRSMSAELL